MIYGVTVYASTESGDGFGETMIYGAMESGSMDGLRHDILWRDEFHASLPGLQVWRVGLSLSIRREARLMLHRDLMTADRIRNDRAGVTSSKIRFVPVKQLHI